MAQRTKKPPRTITTLDWVEKPKPRTGRATNDNTRLPLSGLCFREQKAHQKSALDLSWQIKFALMKLHHWRDADNTDWGPLDDFLKMAQTKFDDLGPV